MDILILTATTEKFSFHLIPFFITFEEFKNYFSFIDSDIASGFLLIAYILLNFMYLWFIIQILKFVKWLTITFINIFRNMLKI